MVHTRAVSTVLRAVCCLNGTLAVILLLVLTAGVFTPKGAQAQVVGTPCQQWISGAGIFRQSVLRYTVNVPANCGQITKTEFQLRTSGQSWSEVRWTNTGFGEFAAAGQPQSKEFFFNLAPAGSMPAAGLREMRVRAFNGSVVGPASSSKRFWIGRPEQPTGLRAEGGHKHVRLSWDDAENPSITRWEVQRKESGAVRYGGWTPIDGSGASTTRHTVSGLDNGTAYSFKVQAVNSAGAGAASAEAEATPVSGAPSAPAGLSAVPGDGRVVLAWRPLGDSSVTKWRIRLKVSSSKTWGEWKDIGGSAAETARHTVSGLTNGTVYDFEISAVNEVGAGGSSGISATPTTATVRTVTVPRAVEVEESAGFATVRVTTEAAFGESVTFNVAYGNTVTTRDNDATGASNPADGDYDNDAVTSVTFSASDTTKDIRIPITNDMVDEGDETFTVTISAAAALPEGFVPGNAATTVTIAEDDVARVTVSRDWVRVWEGGAAGYTVVLDTRPTGDVTVTVGGAGGGVSASPDSLTFTRSNWSTAQSVTVSAAEDADGEDADVRLTHRATGGGYDSAPVHYVTEATQPRTSLRVIVRDNDRKGVTLSVSELKVVEGGSATYTVVLDTQPTGDVAVTVGGMSGDVTVTGPPLTFTSVNWNEAQTVTVNAAEDADDEMDASVTLTHGASGGGYGSVTLDDTVVVSVADDDVPLPAKPANFAAAAGDGEAVLSWTNPNNATISGWKFRQKSGGGSYGGWTPIDDSDASTTSHTVSNLTNGTLYGFRVRAVNAAGDGAASDEETVTPMAPAPCRIGVGNVRAVTSGSARSLSFGVRIPANCGVITGLQYQTRASGRSWGASWTDFDDIGMSGFADSGSARTPSGRETASVSGGGVREVRVRALNGLSEGPASNEAGATFAVPPVPTGLSATAGAASAVLSWDAQAAAQGVTAWVVGYRQGSGDWQTQTVEGGGDTTTATVTGLAAAEHTFRVKARNGNGDSGWSQTATAVPTAATTRPARPANLKATAGVSSVTLTWDDPRDANITKWYLWYKTSPVRTVYRNPTPVSGGVGKLTTTVTGLEPGRSYTFRLSAENAVGQGQNAEATATPTVGLSIADVTASEDGTFRFTVTSAPAPGSAVSFKYTVMSESGDTATEGADFTAVTTPVAATLAANAANATVTVAVADDDLDESDETFTVTLSDASSNATITDDTATGTIEDDDASPVLTALADAGYKVGATVSVTADAADADGDAVTYVWSRKAGETTPALPQGTSLTDAELTFAASATGKYTMTVTASDGNGNSDTEDVVITVHPAANLVSVPSKLTVAEDAGNAVVRITTEAAFGKSMVFNVTYGGGSATGVSDPADGDYDNDAVTSVVFNSTEKTKDIEIPITDDGVDETDEAFTVTIEAAGELPEGFALGNAETTVTIKDDDTDGVTVEPTALRIKEGGSGEYTVVLDAQPSGDVTVTVAGESGDVTVTGSPMTFTPRNYGTEQTVTVKAGEDDDRLTDADVTLRHTASGGGYGTVTIDSVVVSVMESGAPDMPTGLTAVAGNAKVALSWTDPRDVSITGYQVSMRRGRGNAVRWGPWSNIDGSGAGTVSHTVGELRNGSFYRFRIRAVNGAGPSTASAGVDATPMTRPAPVLTAEAGDRKVTLRWKGQPGVGVTYWHYQYRGGGRWIDPGTLLNGGDRSVVVTGLQNDVKYTFRLRAYSGRYSGWSDMVRATPTVGTVSVPAALTVAEDVGNATVRITTERAFGAATTFNVSYGSTSSTSDADATGAGNPADGDYDNDAVTSVVFNATDTTKDIAIPITDDDDDETDETFTVTIAASASLPAGFRLGNAETTVTITDDDASPELTAIEDVSYGVGETADITASATDADGDAVTYVWSRKAGETEPAIPEGTVLTAARLTFVTAAAGKYTMTVTASDGNGNSDTEEVTITVAEKPAEPTGFSVAAGNKQVTLSWDDPDDSSITLWQFRQKKGSGKWTKWTNIDGSGAGTASYTVTGLKNDTEYRFRIRAVNAGGAGAQSGVEAATPSVVAKPVLTAEAGDGRVTLSWNTQPGAGIVSWGYQYKSGEGNNWSATATVAGGGTTGAVVTGLDNGVEYTFRLFALTGGGRQSVWSDWKTATPMKGPGVTVTPTALTINEGSSGTYKVKLDAEPSGNVTVTVGGASGDVTVTGSPMTFTAENYGTEQTVTVSAAADSDATDGTATLTHTASGGGYNSVTIDPVKVTVTDTTPVLQLLADPATVTEGSSISLTITSDKPLTGTLSVSLTLADRGSSGFTAADIPGMLGPRTFDVNFGESATATAAVLIPTSKDAEEENSETYRITLNDTGDYELGADKTADGTLDDGTATVSVPAALTVAEGVGNATVRVTTERAFGAATTFNVSYGSTSSTSDADATGAGNPADGDYDNDAVTSVVFNATDTTKDIAIPITDDDDDETDETFTVTIAASASLPAGFRLGNAETTVTITDDDELSKPAKPTGLTATAGDKQVMLSWDDPDDDSITLWQFRQKKGSGKWTKWTNIDGSDDETASYTITGLENGSEYSFQIRARNAAGNSVKSETETETPMPPAGVTVTPTALTINEGSSGTYKVKLDAEPSGNVTVTVGGASGDVTVTGSPMTFTAENYGTEQTVTVSAAADSDATDGTATLTHTASGGGYNSVTIDPVKVTVTDTTPVLQLLADPATVTEGSSISLTITSDKPLTGTLSVSLTLADRGSSGFTAADIPGMLGPRTFDVNFGESATATAAVLIPTSKDAEEENSETYRITLNDTGDYELGADKTADGTLDDGTATVSVPAALTVAEGVGNATVRVTTERAFGAATTFNVSYGSTSSTSDADATGAGNPADGDYDNDAVTSVVFNATDTTKDIAIPITDDDDDETDETFTVTIAASASLPAGFRLGNAETTVTITDDDELSKPAKPTGLTATAGDKQVMLSWDDPDDDSITLWQFRQKKGSGKWTKWTNIDGSDDETASYTITGLENGSEYSFQIRARNAAGNSVKSETETETPMPPAGVTVTPTALTINEGSSGTYKVKLDAEPSGNVTVTVGGASGDVTVTGSPMTFTAENYGTEQTVTVSAAADSDATDGTATLTHTASGGGYNSVTIDPVKVTVTDTTPVLQLLADPATVTEGSSISLTITSDKPLTGTLSVSLTLADRGSSGFTAADIPGMLGPRTFDVNFGESATATAAVLIPTSKDAEEENSETYRITLNDTGDYELGADKTADGTLDDGTATVSVPAALTVAEGVGNATVRVTTERAFGAATTFNVSYGSTSSTSDADATGAGNPADGDYDNDAVTSVVFNATDTTKDIAIPITDDDDDETDETFTVTIAASASLPAGFRLGNAETTVTITDDDELSKPAKPTGLTATAGDKQVMLSWDDPDDDSITLWQFRQKKGSGKWTKWTNIDDSDDETASYTITGLENGSEYSFQIRARNAAGNSVKSETETETPMPPAGVTVTPTALTINEGSSGTYKVKLDAEPSGNVTVTVGGASGDVTVTGSPMTFTAENYGTEQTVTVSAAADSDATDGTATLTHTASGGGYNSVTIDPVKVTVTDTTPVLQLLADPATVTEGSSISLTITSDKPLTGTLSVSLTLADRGSSGFTAADIPGMLGPRTFDVNFGESATATAAVLIPTSKDAEEENSETYRITLNDTDDYELGADKTADGTLNDDSGTVSVPAALAVTEGTDANATVTITASKALGQAVTFNISYGSTSTTSDADATGAGNPADGDYDNDAVTSVVFNATDTTKDIVIPITDDEEAEGDETFTVTIAASASLPAGFKLGNAETKVTIGDNEQPAAPTGVTGTAGAGEVTLRWDDPSDSSITGWQYQQSPPGDEDQVSLLVGDAVPSSAAEENYGPWNNIPGSGPTTTSYTVTGLTGGVEYSFRIRAVNAAGSSVASAAVRATPSGAVSEVSLSIADVTAAEDGTFAFTVTAEPAPTSRISFRYTVTAESGDTATAGEDFTAVKTPVEAGIAAGEATTTITVTVIDDSINEDDETFTVTLSQPSSGVMISDGVARGTITDNERAAGVTVAPTELTVDEGSSGTYTVVLESKPAGEVTITMRGAAGDVSVDRTSLVFTADNWNEARTITVSAASDDDAVTDPDVTLTHSASGGGYDSVSIDSVVITVTEDDTAAVTVAPTELTVDEGSSGTYAVVLESEPTGEVTITVRGAAGDVTVDRASLEFTADDWDTVQTVTVSAAGDRDLDDERVTLTHSASGGDYGSVKIDSVQVLVKDTTAERLNTINRVVLPRVTAAIMSQSLDAISYRIEAAASGNTADTTLRFGNTPSPPTEEDKYLNALWPEDVSEDLGIGMREALDGMEFSLGLNGQDGGEGMDSSTQDGQMPWAVWGRGNWMSLSGSDEDISWNGGLWTAHLGADVRLRNLLAGWAVSRTEGDFDANSEGSQGLYRTTLTSVHPYAAWLAPGGSSLWASAGYGRGNVRIGEDQSVISRADLTFTGAALGGRLALGEGSDMIAGGMTRFAIKGEGSFARAKTGADNGLAELEVDVRRLRMALQASHERVLESGAAVTPTLEIGVRHDGGDMSGGAGLEAGASLSYNNPTGLTVELRTRTLADHEQDWEEWGMSASVVLEPGGDGRGTFLKLESSRGDTGSGIESLFDRGTAELLSRSGTDARSSMNAEIGHGFGLGGVTDLSVLSPYAGLSLEDGGSRYLRLGTRYRLGDGVDLDLEGIRREQQSADAENGIMLKGNLRW